MATFSGDKPIEDDVEAPFQHSGWSSKVGRTLCIMKEEVENEMGFQILKVPEYHRRPPAEFTPQAWRFGLHNRENLDTTGSEALKLYLVVAFGLGDQADWIQFYKAVVPDSKSMLVCYGLHKAVLSLSDNDMKQVLALDALYLAFAIDMRLNENDQRFRVIRDAISLDKHMLRSTFQSWNRVLRRDLCRIENQVPFILIKRAIEHIEKLKNPESENEDYSVLDNKPGQVPAPYLEKWIREAVGTGIRNFMKTPDGFYRNANAHLRLSESRHILDATYKAICGMNGIQWTSDHSHKESYIHIPSATRLRESGIRIVEVVGPLCTMSYNKDNNCLSLPKMRILDETVAFVRNIARYEEYSREGECVFHDYILVMADLIETLADMKFLTDRGVVHNGCGLHKGFEMWKALNQGFSALPSSKKHNEMKRDINSRCKLKRHRFWREFQTLFLSRPWLTLSAIAVVLVTAATLIQTYASIIGSNGMKPQFKP